MVESAINSSNADDDESIPASNETPICSAGLEIEKI